MESTDREDENPEDKMSLNLDSPKKILDTYILNNIIDSIYNHFSINNIIRIIIIITTIISWSKTGGRKLVVVVVVVVVAVAVAVFQVIYVAAVAA